MAAKTLLECSFLIPTRRDKNLSDGKAHPDKAWRWLGQQLRLLGGWTRAKELYEGGYEDPDTGEWVSDLSRKYFVALPRDDLDKLRRILREACEEFAQKCIYLSVAGRVEFVERATDEDK